VSAAAAPAAAAAVTPADSHDWILGFLPIVLISSLGRKRAAAADDDLRGASIQLNELQRDRSVSNAAL
jgi:hypothetical protein